MEENVINLERLKNCIPLIREGILSMIPIRMGQIMEGFETQKETIDKFMRDKGVKYELYCEDELYPFTVLLYADAFHKKLYEYVKFCKENGGKVPPFDAYAYYRALGYTDEKEG